MKFTGHERDLASAGGAGDDLDYMHARHCSPLVGRFLGVDPDLGNSAQPQSWNRYVYVMNNPLKYLDPLGRYTVNCTSGDRACEAKAAAFENARQKALDHKDKGVRNAALAYGSPGEANGITVGFAVPTGGRGAVTTHYIQGNMDGTVSLAATVTVNPDLAGTDLVAAVAHEGQHIVDAQGFVATFALNAASWDISTNLTTYQVEMNAYRLTHSVFAAADQRFGGGCQGCDLGRGIKTDADRDMAIKRILANPDGHYKVTPENQGPRQFSEWSDPP
jgi:RHS repeat-associated protein